jgi:hypothetical protein
MNPRPPLLRNFTQEIHVVKVKVKTSKAKPPDGDFVAATRGLRADAFFGASPVVASALDLRQERDLPAERTQINTHLFSARPKPDISTLRRIGHFYFALTELSAQYCMTETDKPLREYLLDHLAGDVGEPEVAALELVG